MLTTSRTLVDGFVLSLVFSAFVIGTLLWNHRIWIQDFPPDIRALVPEKTDREERVTRWVAVPFFLIVLAGPLVSLLLVERQAGNLDFIRAWIHAYLVWEFVNVWDWLVLDWIGFSLIDPRKPPIPGTEGAEGWRDYGFHFRGFLKGSVMGIAFAAIPAGLAMLW